MQYSVEAGPFDDSLQGERKFLRCFGTEEGYKEERGQGTGTLQTYK